MDSLTIGPDTGTLTLHTGVEGKAAKMGHALTVGLSDWAAEVTLEQGAPTSVTLRAGLASFEVQRGEGGVKPLSDKDKRTIRDSALGSLAADKHPDVTFTSTAVQPRDGGWSIDGQLTVAGVARPTRIDVDLADAGDMLSLSALVPVVQTEHGVKPYSAMMGALKLRDRVDVRVAATVPRP